MKRNLVVAVLLAAFVPALAAQSTASLTGKWEGTLTMQRPDGTEGNPVPAEFNLTQKGKELSGTAGPPEQQRPIENGAVNEGKATFQVQQPNGGPLIKFSLTLVKGRLQGEMTGERDGEVRRGKIDVAKAAPAKK